LQRCRDFCDFQDGGSRHLRFSYIQNFNGLSAAKRQCASSCQISSKSVERSQIYGDLTVSFQNGGRPPSWICWAPTGTTHENHLVVSIVTQNLVKIDVVVSIDNKKLSILCPFGLKTPIHAAKLFFGVFHPQNGEQY